MLNAFLQLIQKHPLAWLMLFIFVPTLCTHIINFQSTQSQALEQAQIKLHLLTAQKQAQLAAFLAQIRHDVALQQPLPNQPIAPHLQKYELQDYLLLDPQGKILYSQHLEPGSNLLNGEQRNSQFAHAVRLALARKTTVLSDLENFGHIPHTLSFFACHPVLNPQGSTVAVLALQIPYKKLAHLFETEPALGSTLKMALLSEDGLILSQLSKRETNVQASNLTTTPSVSNNTLSSKASLHHPTSKQIIHASPLSDTDLHWVLQGSQDEKEILTPAYQTLGGNLVVSLIFATGSAWLLFYALAGFKRHLIALRIQTEQLHDMPCQYPHDASELDKLHSSIQTLAQHIAQICAQLDRLATGAIRDYMPHASSQNKLGLSLQKLQAYLSQTLHNLQYITQTSKNPESPVAESRIRVQAAPHDLFEQHLMNIWQTLIEHDVWRKQLQHQHDAEQAIIHACAQHITLRDMGQNILSEICLQTNTQAGLLHIVDEHGKLEAIAHFGLKLSESASPIRQNTNLLQQISQTEHIRHIENIAANFLEIETGLGSSKTISLLLAPLHSHNKLAGVLELCSLAPYASEHITLLKHMQYHIADTLHIGMLYRHIHTLIAQNNEQSKALQQANDEALRASRYKNRFLANISHEIRTPLNGVLGMAQIGQRMNVGATGQQLFAQMFESGKLLLGVVNDMLDFSNIESGKLSVDRTDVKLAHIIKHVVVMCGDRASAKGIFLRMESMPGLPEWFKGDPLRIAQVLIKLVNHAIQNTNEGEVLFSIQSSRSRLIFSIQSEGPDLSSEEISVLFRPFEAHHLNEGTGLELAISKQLVELMSGKLHYKNVPQGGMFIMELPLEITPPPQSDALPVLTQEVEISQKIKSLSDITQYFTNLRILAAEDNIVNRMVLENMLSLEGVTLVCVENGQAALDIIQQNGETSWDIVLTDIHMPVMDGHQLAQHLREIAPTLPIVGVTAHAFDAEKERCLASGMVAHVSKPIVMSELLNVILRYARKPQPETNIPPLATSDLGINWSTLLEQFQGREVFVNKLLQVLIQSHSDTPNKLRAAIEQQNLEQLAFIAHSFAGVASQVHADTMRAFAKHVENQAKIKQEDAYALGAELAEKITQFMNQLQTHIHLAGD